MFVWIAALALTCCAVAVVAFTRATVPAALRLRNVKEADTALRRAFPSTPHTAELVQADGTTTHVEAPPTTHRAIEAGLVAAPSAAFAAAAVGDTIQSAASLDIAFLSALRQLSGRQVEGLADLRSVQEASGYQLDSYKLRGMTGEHEAFEHFSVAGHSVSWPSGGTTEFGSSNNPGWDLAINGEPVNVKIVSDATSALDDHFSKYPDIPVVINADASNIPSDALRFDPEVAFNPADIVGDHVVIVDQALTLTGLEAMQDAAIEATAENDWIDSGVEVFPGLGLLVAAVRSAYREGRLLHGGQTDTQRALRNVAIDTAARGGGAVTGAVTGAKVGAAVDLATGGATLGLGTAIGGLIGAVGGAVAGGQLAEHLKLAPLREAQESLKESLAEYDAALNKQYSKGQKRLQRATDDASTAFQEQVSAIQDAYEDLLDDLHAAIVDASWLSADCCEDLISDADDAAEVWLEDLQRSLEDLRGPARWLGERRLRKSRSTIGEWRRRIGDARMGYLEGTIEQDDFLRTLLALPLASNVLDHPAAEAAEARRTARVTAALGNHQMVNAIATARADHVASLSRRAAAETRKARKALRPHMEGTAAAVATVQRELEMAGRATDPVE